MEENNRPTVGVQAQQAVIGSMLIDDRCVGVVLSQMTPDNFTDSVCKNAFQAIKRLFVAGKPVDAITVRETVGGGDRYAQWLWDIAEMTPTAANVEAYCETARKETAKTRAREYAQKMLYCDDLDELENLNRKQAAALRPQQDNATWTVAEWGQNFYTRMTSKEKPEYLTWGFPSIDRATYAELGDMVILGGYSSSGKTLLSILMALEQAKRYKVGYYTLETQREKMADRIMAHLCPMSLKRIKERDFSEKDLSRFATTISTLVTEGPVDLVHASKWTVDEIAAHALYRGYQIIYIDYLQLIEGSGSGQGEYDKVTATSRALKMFAQSNGVAVVALSQLTRPKPEKYNEKPAPPNMNSFRSSGQIEQDADLAFLLWPEDTNDNTSNRILKLAKNKEGERAKITLHFDGATQTMVEVEQRPDTSVAAQLSAAGRAVKAANRAQAQMKFSELPGDDGDNPFA